VAVTRNVNPPSLALADDGLDTTVVVVDDLTTGWVVEVVVATGAELPVVEEVGDRVEFVVVVALPVFECVVPVVDFGFGLAPQAARTTATSMNGTARRARRSPGTTTPLGWTLVPCPLP
jgi:hypothetical protein